jgi:hypothetical protein
VAPENSAFILEELSLSLSGDASRDHTVKREQECRRQEYGEEERTQTLARSDKQARRGRQHKNEARRSAIRKTKQQIQKDCRSRSNWRGEMLLFLLLLLVLTQEEEPYIDSCEQIPEQSKR